MISIFMLKGPVNDPSQLFTWEATLFALEGPPYADLVIKLLMYFTPEYTLKPPKVKFKQEIFHPNMHKGEYLLTFCRISGV